MNFIDKYDLSKVKEYGDYCISHCQNDLWHFNGRWIPFTDEEIQEYKESIWKRIEKKYIINE